MKSNNTKGIPIVRNANGRDDCFAEREMQRGGRGWAAIFLAAKFEEALVVLESNRAPAGAVDRIEAIRNRAQAG